MTTRQFDQTIRNQALAGDAKRTSILMFVSTFVLATIIPILYVTSEHVFYWWDYAGYQDLTNATAHNFLIDPWASLAGIYGSTHYDYNTWFTLPLIPFVVVGGFSRLSYVLGVTWVYLYPFALVAGSITAKLIPGKKEKIFWLAVVFTLCMPPVWVATLRGYPDIGGALFLILTLLFYLRDSYLEEPKSIFVMGACLALAMIFRRHFAYGALGFLISLFLYNNARIIALANIQKKDAFKTLFVSNLRLILIPLVLLATLFFLARPFFDRILLRQYASLYASYMVPIQDVAYFLLSQYGIVIWVIATVAVLWLSVKQGQKSNMTFIGVLALVLFAQWIVFVRQTGFHYTLQFLFFLVIGICSFAHMLVPMRHRVPMIPLLLVGLVLNFLFGLTELNPLSSMPLEALVAAKQTPLQHPDYAEIQEIIRYLHQHTGHSEPIFVAASSELLNYDILRHAEDQNEGLDTAHLNFLRSPDADSRDDYPLEQLLDAQYVIVASPFQYHLAPEEQDVVRVVVAAFLSDWPIAQDFEQLDAKFQLSRGINVTIFHRIRPTSINTAVQTLRGIRQYLSAEIPGKQPDWIALDGKLASITHKTLEATTYSSLEINAGHGASTLLLSRPLPEHLVINSVLVQTSCHQVGITLRVMDERGGVTVEQQIDLNEDEFSQAIDHHPGKFATLIIGDQSLSVDHSCTVVLETLTILDQ